MPSSTPQIGTTTNTGAVGIGVTTPLAKLDISTSATLGGLNIRGRNMQFPGNPATTGITPFALKVEFNETIYGPSGISTTALLDCQGKLFLGEFTNYTSVYHVNTKAGGIAVFGNNQNRLSLTYNPTFANLISWNTDNTAPRRNLGFSFNGAAPFFNLTPEGQVLIATDLAPQDYKLCIGGKAIAEEVTVKLQGNWPDYVFAANYRMLSSQDLREYIATNGKLPYLPAAAEVQENGIALGQTQAQLTRLVEELTLRLLEMDKRVEELETKLSN